MLLVTTAPVFGQEYYTDGLSGRIHKLKEFNLTPLSMAVYSGLMGNNTLTVYGEEGEKLKEYEYGPEGYLLSKSVYKYKKGNLIQVRSYSGDGTFLSATLYDYNRKGFEVARKFYGSNGLLVRRTEAKYDKSGNVVEEQGFDLDGVMISKATWKYDKERNPIEEVVYDADEIETRRSVYEYDSKGNRTSVSNTYYGVTLKTEYKYNEDGLVVSEQSYNAEGVADKKIEYSYDKQGYAVSERYFSADGTLQKTLSFKNEYDTKNNLISKTEISGKKKVVILRREIDYF